MMTTGVRMSTLKELKVKVIDIKEPDINVKGMRMIGHLNEYAEAFNEKFRTAVEELEDWRSILNKMKELDGDIFYLWLCEQPNFCKAKARLIDAGSISANLEMINLNKQSYQYLLAYICGLSICFLATDIELGDAIVVPVEWSRLVKKYEKQLILMSRNFELPAEAQLFLYLIRQLQKSKGNVLNSGARRETQAREFMTKQLMYSINQNFKGESLTANLLANMALDISGIFFDAMKQSDARDLAVSVIEASQRNQMFLEQKVIEVLSNQQMI